MYKDDIFGEDNKTLNSNIGCFEIVYYKVTPIFKNELNSNIGCFEIS